jgi:lipoprotein NlpD
MSEGSSQVGFRSKVIIMVALIFVVAGCGPKTRWDHTPREEHVVRTGETLFTIAWRYGEDPRDLARWNKLGDGSLIYPGQVIRLMPPSGERRSSSAASSKPAGSRPLPPIPMQPAPPWSWPVTGKVTVEFGDRPGTGTGLLIDGTVGQPIKAAAAGTVVYSGSGLIGYGELIIVKHNDTYLSAYGHNASLLVREGQAINKGQRIATMGEGPGGKPRLHFEIRRNGKPVNPRQYLPAR